MEDLSIEFAVQRDRHAFERAAAYEIRDVLARYAGLALRVVAASSQSLPCVCSWDAVSQSCSRLEFSRLHPSAHDHRRTRSQTARLVAFAPHQV